MTFSVLKEEWKHLTYLVRLAMLVCDFIWAKAVCRTLSKGFQMKLFVVAVVVFVLLFYGTYLSFRTPYFCIPMSRYYNANVLKKSIENETFTVLKENVIWESEHWLRIKDTFFPKSLIGQLTGSAGSATIMIIRTIDNKEYTLHQMGHLKRNQEEKIIASVLPITRILKEKGYDNPNGILWLPRLSDKMVNEMLTNYLANHSVEDLIHTTDLMEMYALIIYKEKFK